MSFLKRLFIHDFSKYMPFEAKIYSQSIQTLKNTTYGTPSYTKAEDEVRPAIDHHYKFNRHHVKFHKNGINDMTFIDILEMIIDWASAIKRHKDGDLNRSLEYNKKRYEMSEQLFGIFKNTINEYFQGGVNNGTINRERFYYDL